MAYDFPSSPGIGQTFTPAVGGPTYVWQPPVWRLASGGVHAGVYVGEMPPANPVQGMLWFNSATGNSFIYFTDVDSSAWVQFNVAPPVPLAPSDGDSYVMKDGVWAKQTGAVKLAEGTTAGSQILLDVPLPTTGFTAFEIFGTAINPTNGAAVDAMAVQAWYGGTLANGAYYHWTQDSILANGAAGAGWNASSAFNTTNALVVPNAWPLEHYGIFHMRFPLVQSDSLFNFICDSYGYGNGASTRSRCGGGLAGINGPPTKLSFWFHSGYGFQNGGRWQLNGIR